jgi:hypothetical protein
MNQFAPTRLRECGLDVPKPSFLFDLDGTLADRVYQHVLAWNEALEAEGIGVSIWRIHRKIGMCGGLLTDVSCAKQGCALTSS